MLLREYNISDIHSSVTLFYLSGVDINHDNEAPNAPTTIPIQRRDKQRVAVAGTVGPGWVGHSHVQSYFLET